MINIHYTTIENGKDKYSIFTTDKGICLVGMSLKKGEEWIEKHMKSPLFIENDNHPILVTAQKELLSYLKGNKIIFSGPYDLKGTEFQKTIWKNLLKIPYGKTVSYGFIAHQISNPKAVRAVGGACGANPVMIMIPCHRVVGGNGKLTGYAGGLSTKEWLLNLEKK